MTGGHHPPPRSSRQPCLRLGLGVPAGYGQVVLPLHQFVPTCAACDEAGSSVGVPLIRFCPYPALTMNSELPSFSRIVLPSATPSVSTTP